MQRDTARRLALTFARRYRTACRRRGLEVDDLEQVARLAEIEGKDAWASLRRIAEARRAWPRAAWPYSLEALESNDGWDAVEARIHAGFERWHPATTGSEPELPDVELSPRQAEVLRRVYWLDQSFTQVARELGLHEATVREHHEAAIRRYRAAFGLSIEKIVEATPDLAA